MDEFSQRVAQYLSSLTHFKAVPASRGDVCTVCCGPTGADPSGLHYTKCLRCTDHWHEAGRNNRLATTTHFITYALQHRDKSADMALADMYAYKNPNTRDDRRSEAFSRIASLLYSGLLSLIGYDQLVDTVDIVTIVPSSKLPGKSPLFDVADRTLRRINNSPPLMQTLEWNEAAKSRRHRFDTNKFQVLDTRAVAGEIVLLIEDTWVSGANAQSAAVALHRAGANQVIVLTVARMLDEGSERCDYLCRRYPTLEAPSLHQ